MHKDKDTILTLYNQVMGDYMREFSHIRNCLKLGSFLQYYLKSSCAKLLAAKYQLGSQKRVYRQFGPYLAGGGNITFLPPCGRSKVSSLPKINS
jgi:hypothetical protein